jgi:DNA (cytosine-5)-methyltransferase 1
MNTITAQGSQGALVAAFLAKHYGDRGQRPGSMLEEPFATITAQDHHALVYAFLMKFYSEGGQWQSPRDPMHTIPTKDRMALVTVRGEDYYIADIGMRMLQPRELFLAQGFPPDYIIDQDADGVPFTKTAQVRMCGNSVCPPVAAAIVRANLGELAMENAA